MMWDSVSSGFATSRLRDRSYNICERQLCSFEFLFFCEKRWKKVYTFHFEAQNYSSTWVLYEECKIFAIEEIHKITIYTS